MRNKSKHLNFKISIFPLYLYTELSFSMRLIWSKNGHDYPATFILYHLTLSYTEVWKILKLMTQNTNKSRSIPKYQRLSSVSNMYKYILQKYQEKIYSFIKEKCSKAWDQTQLGLEYRLVRETVIIVRILFTGSVHIIHTFLTGNNIWFSRRLFDIIELSGISLMKGNTLVCLSVGDILPCAWCNSPP